MDLTWPRMCEENLMYTFSALLLSLLGASWWAGVYTCAFMSLSLLM